METKDWIELIFPVICNGILLFIFHEKINRKIAHLDRKQDLRDSVVKKFWEALQELNDTFIATNVAAMVNPKVAGDSLPIFQGEMLKIIQYYDTNQFDLSIFDASYKKLLTCWRAFEQTYLSYAGKSLTPNMQQDLGYKLQAVKDSNQSLINEVRKKY